MTSKVVGRDVPPETGMRVESVDGFNGVGTIISVAADGNTAMVRWDNGTMQRDASTGSDGAYSLISAGPSTRSSGRYTSAPNEGQRGDSLRAPANGNGNGFANGNNGPSNQFPAQLPNIKTGQSAKIGLGPTTVGLSLFGNKVDYMLPGGPAQLSQQLDKHDEIIEVDGKRVQDQDITQMLVGVEGGSPSLRLKVRKAHTGQMVDVELERVPKTSMEEMVRLFELLTQLKQNGHNNDGYERETFPPNQQLTSPLVDAVVAQISRLQLEQHAREAATRTQFQKLYGEVRSHLGDAYAEIDGFEQVKARFMEQATVLRDEAERAREESVRFRAQVEKALAQVDAVNTENEQLKTALAATRDKLNQEVEEERALHGQLDDWKQTHHLSDQEVKAIVRELAQKKEDLAQEIETGMQRDFEIRRLQAQCVLYVEELEAARLNLMAKDDEMARRSLEDVELEKKIEALKEHLERAFETVQAKEEEIHATKLSVAEKVAEVTAVKDKQLDETRAQVAAKAEELSAARAEAAKLQQQVADLEGALRERGGQLDDAQKRLDETAAAAAELQAALAVARAKIEELERNAEMAAWRAGDVLEVTVARATHLADKGSDEVYVMVSLDHKHQVNQTDRVVGKNPQFDMDCVCAVAQTNHEFYAAVYAGPPGKTGEFVGGCSLRIGDIPFHPGLQSAFELKDTDGKQIKDAQGQASKLELTLTRTNHNKNREAMLAETKRKLEEALAEGAKDEAEIAKLYAEAARLNKELEALKPVVESEKQLTGEVAQLKVLLAECGGKIEHQVGMIAELEDSLKTKSSKLSANQKDLVQKEKERQTLEVSFQAEVAVLKARIDEDELKIREGLAAAAERDALLPKKASLENEVQSLRQEYADFEQKEDKKSKADAARIRELEAEIKRLTDELAESTVQISKLKGGLDSERDAHNIDSAELESEKKHDSELEAKLLETDKRARTLDGELFAARKRIEELEAQLAEATASRDAVSKELKELQDVSNNDKDALAAQAERIREMEWEVKELQKPADDGGRGRIEALEKQVEELTKEGARLAAALSGKEGEVAKLREELDSDEARIAEDERRWAERKKQVGADQAEHERRLHEFEAKLLEAERMIAGKTAEHAKELEHLHNQLADKTADVEAREKELQAQIDDLEARLQEAKTVAREAAARAAAGASDAAAAARLAHLEDEVTDLTERLRDAERRAERASAASASAAGGASQREQDLEAECATLKKTLSDVMGRLKAAKQQQGGSDGSKAREAELEKAVAALESKLQEAEKLLREADKRAAAAEVASSAQGGSRAESKKKYEAEVLALQQQVVKLQEKWQETQRKDRAEYEGEVTRLEVRPTTPLRALPPALPRQRPAPALPRRHPRHARGPCAALTIARRAARAETHRGPAGAAGCGGAEAARMHVRRRAGPPALGPSGRGRLAAGGGGVALAHGLGLAARGARGDWDEDREQGAAQGARRRPAVHCPPRCGLAPPLPGHSPCTFLIVAWNACSALGGCRTGGARERGHGADGGGALAKMML